MERSDIDWSAATAPEGSGRRAGSKLKWLNEMRLAAGAAVWCLRHRP